MSEQKHGIATKVLHAGHQPDQDTGSRAVPIYQTTSFTFNDTAHAADLFALKREGYIYTRLGNPTTDVLEKRLAAMHDGVASVATASGMSAIFYTVAAISSAGQNFVTGSNLYGGTTTLFHHTLSRFGITARFVDTSNIKEVAAAIDQDTRLVFTESIGNPRCNVDDLEALARVAHMAGVPFVVDNTMAPPPLSNPFDYGCDIAVYSLTKMIGGHGTAIGGAIVEKGDFDWAVGGRYPEMTEPDPSYHGMRFYEAACDVDPAVGPQPCPAFSMKVRTGLMRDIGAAPSPFNSFLLLQGLETLALRARAHTSGAQKVAEFLAGHPAVDWVNYAGLPDHPDHERAGRYFPLGPGAVFGFGIKGGKEAGRRFIDSVRLCSHLANILDAKTLVIHPASTTHSQLEPDELAASGVSPEMVRISVGIEEPEDIIADLDQALAASQAAG